MPYNTLPFRLVLMDYFLLRSVTNALSSLLPGTRVRRVLQTIPLGVELDLGGGLLFFALDPGMAGAYWFSRAPAPAERGHFARYLEGLLRGAMVKRVLQVPRERILHLELAKRDFVGQEDVYTLIAEIMGRRSNLIVLDKEGRILEAAKRVYRNMSRVREVLPGRPYTPPPPHNRLDPFILKREAFLELLTEGATPLDALAHHTLFPSYALKEMAFRLGHGAQGPSTLLRCWEVWRGMTEEIEKGEGFLYRREGRAFGVYPLPLHHMGEGERGPILSILELFAREMWENQATNGLRSKLSKVVRGELKKVTRTLSLLKQEERVAQDADLYRKWGETLLIHLSRIPPGGQEVEVEDPYNPKETLRIPIPTGLKPSKAAQEYFRRYSKLKRKAKAVTIRKEELETRRRYLEELDWLLGSAPDLRELELMREELVEQGLIKGEKPKKSNVLPYRVFRSSRGNTILVGRHPRGNEEVTFRRSDRRDLWFHVRGYPGAHVILKNPQPSNEEIQEAATLAAYFSKARQAPAVEVDYTQRRHVRKIPKAAPGLVTYTDFSTIRVKPQMPPEVTETS